MRRKAAGTLLVDAQGRAAHSGSAPDQGRNALLALARVADHVAGFHDPDGPDQLSVVPTVMRSGEAFNVVPARAELICDMRARGLEAFEPVLAARARRARRGGDDHAHGPRLAGDGRRGRDRRAARGRRRRGSAARSSACRAAAPRTRATSPRRSR